MYCMDGRTTDDGRRTTTDDVDLFHIYLNISEVGGVSPTGKSFRFVHVCDAMLHVPAGRCCFRGWAAEAQEILRRVVASRRRVLAHALRRSVG